jgi:hypothetical protein
MSMNAGSHESFIFKPYSDFVQARPLTMAFKKNIDAEEISSGF